MEISSTLRRVALAALTLAAAGCTTEPTSSTPRIAPLPTAAPTVPHSLVSADRYLGDRQFTKAVETYTAFLKSEPGNARARIGLAEAYLGIGKPELALAALDGVTDTTGQEAAFFQARGGAHALTGRDAEAKSDLEAAVARDPSLWLAWSTLGRVHDRQGDWMAADAAYARAIEANPKAPDIHNNFGVSLMMRGDYEGAAARFSQALALSPRFDAALDNLALARALQGNYEAALAGVPQEKLPQALNNVGFVALTRGDSDMAEEYLTRAIRSSPRHFAVAAENLRWLKYANTAPQP